VPTGFSESRRCPGEKYAISEAVCCARTARHFPKCKECKWRDQPSGPQAPQREQPFSPHASWTPSARFSSGRNISMPKTVPSDEARHRPLVVIAKKT
jgi:hypothetical protein